MGIAYPNVTTLSLMSQTLSALREKFPLLHAQPVKMPALQLLQSLDDGTASMAIVFHEMIRNRTDLAYVLLRRGRMSALVLKTHELASRPYLDYATLRSYPLILHEMSANQLEMTGMLAELSAHGIDYHYLPQGKARRGYPATCGDGRGHWVDAGWLPLLSG
ncbi:MAG: LysR family transcriptional regulator substrate-binding protein [Oscillospiraceae bacterium]